MVHKIEDEYLMILPENVASIIDAFELVSKNLESLIDAMDIFKKLLEKLEEVYNRG